MPKPPSPRPSSDPGVERSIALGERIVAYRLRRSARKSIGLTIDQRGLRVGAPLRARLGDIETLIRQHGDWVLTKLDAWRDAPPPAPATQRIEDGMTLPLLGAPLRIRLGLGGNRAVWSADRGTLNLCRRDTGSDPAPLLEKTLREFARAHFAARLAALAPGLGVATPPLALSSARTRWGSCSSRGNIRLNWRLIFLAPEIVDYVVAHELAHLREMNHSPRFWSLVETLCPDWRRLRAELKRQGPSCPIF